LEQTNTVESIGVREAFIEASSEDLAPETFRRLGAAAFSTDSATDELLSLVEEWDSFSGSLGSKGAAGILHGFALLTLGRADEAEEVLKGQKKQEWGLYFLVEAIASRSRLEEALETAEEGREKFPDHLPIVYLLIDLLAQAGRVEDASKVLEKLRKKDGQSASFLYANGRCLEKSGEYAEAIQAYRDATRRDSRHAAAYFRLGYLIDIYGQEAEEANEEAIAAYESCVKLIPAHTNAVVNLGLLYEDRERYHDAIKCYETVLRRFPNHERARLYLGDAVAATRMFYDKEQEKKADRHSQVLKIPVSDFELSVRSRNCLQKMNIETLGDLIMKTEQELLSYKNFGETSLAEIKEMLGQKGLRLGQGLETKAGDSPAGRNPLEATASPEVLQKSIDELDLSVRSRRCMERLEVRTIRDLINKTEVELMSAKNFGMTSLNEIKRKLADLGLALRS
jgi:DNA-directed RNA polymerase subunit alpha